MDKLFKNKFVKPTKKEVLKALKDTLLVILGTIILACATELFLIQSQLVTGGVSGIAICFKMAGLIKDTELFITILTWSLFVLGLVFLGWRFSLQTLCSTIVYPIALFGIKALANVWPWLLLSNSAILEYEPGLICFLSSVFGGVLVGTGCAITFLGGGSTGGVDILTFIICKFFRFIKSSASIFTIDALIVISGFMINKDHDIALCLEGVLSAFIGALVIDKLFTGSSKMFVAYIVSEKYEDITNEIITKLDRTTSIIDIQGGYTKEKKKMVMVSFSMREYSTVSTIVYANDKKAFMTINRAHEINGEGFKPLRKN